MKKFFLAAFALLLATTVGDVTAQETKTASDSYIKNRISLNVGAKVFQQYGFDDMLASVDVLYGLNNWLEAGLFTSGRGSYVNYRGSYVNYGENDVKYDLVLYYGVAAKAHLLPIIINPSYRRFDVYANLHLGAKSALYNHDSRGIDYSRTSLYVNGGLGVGYNFNKRIGLFYECNYSNSDNMIYGVGNLDGLNHKLGVRLRFNDK